MDAIPLLVFQDAPPFKAGSFTFRLSFDNSDFGLILADIGSSGEFHLSYLSCGTIYETLAMAKPLIHYREDNLYQKYYPELYPMINIKNPQDVSNALLDYIERPDYYKTVGEKGQKWLREYAINGPIDEYVKIIKDSQ